MKHVPEVGCCEHCNGTGVSTMPGIYLMDVKSMYSLPRNDSSPFNQIKSYSAPSSCVFIPLQEPTSPTHHTKLTIPTGI
jgi:hypothetical protein